MWRNNMSDDKQLCKEIKGLREALAVYENAKTIIKYKGTVAFWDRDLSDDEWLDVFKAVDGRRVSTSKPPDIEDFVNGIIRSTL
jgi:hypothetical protein